MTTDTLTPPVADADAAEKRRQLETEAAQRQIKFDKRYSDKRLADMIAEHDAKQAMVPAGPRVEVFVKEVDAVVTASETARANDTTIAELDALRKRNAELEAAAAAQPAPPPYSAPKGMLTTMNMRQAGDMQKDEDERRLLMDRAMTLGIASEIPPRANNDSIRDHIMRHVANKADQMRQREEMDKLRAAGPKHEFVSLRVLHLGHNIISKGIHIPGVGDACFQKGDIIENVALPRAQELEATGMGEIVG
jgi:hypothetical protein